MARRSRGLDVGWRDSRAACVANRHGRASRVTHAFRALEGCRAPSLPPAVTSSTQSRKAACASAPLFMARSVSRAETMAWRSSAAVKPRAQAAWLLQRQSGILRAAATPRGLPRSARARAHTSSRRRVVHMASRAWGDTDSIRPSKSRHLRTSRAANASTNSQGFTSAVRATSPMISCSFTASVPRCASAIFLSSLSRWTVFSPTRSTSARAAPSVSVTPWPTAMARTVFGSSLRLSGAQSMTAVLPWAATALYRRVFFASFSATRASTVDSLGDDRYDTRASASAFFSLSAPRTSTRRTGLANGTVLQAATTSPPRAVSPLNSSALNDRSPSAARRARRRFITVSRLSASSPTIR